MQTDTAWKCDSCGSILAPIVQLGGKPALHLVSAGASDVESNIVIYSEGAIFVRGIARAVCSGCGHQSTITLSPNEEAQLL